MTSSASTDTFPADVAAKRRASGITIAPEAALHRALQERTDELERVRAELAETRAELARHRASAAPACQRGCMLTTPYRESVRPAPLDDGEEAAGAADPRRGRTPDEIRAWAAGLFGG